LSAQPAVRELNPEIRFVSLQPDGPVERSRRLEHMATALRPAIYDDTLADENLEVSTEEA